MICKKYSISFCLLALFAIFWSPVCSAKKSSGDDSSLKNESLDHDMENKNEEQRGTLAFEDDEDFDFSFDDDMDLDLFVDSQPMRSTCLSNLIVPILSQSKMLDLFKQDIYLRTHPLNERNILDDPIFYTNLSDKNKLSLTWHLFFNQTSKSFFSKTGNGIGSFLAVDNSPFVNTLQEAFNVITSSEEPRDFFVTFLDIGEEIFATDIRANFALFKNARVEERRVGVMFDLLAPFNNLNYVQQLIFNLKLPLVWRERNFNISAYDQARIRESAIRLYPKAAEAPTPSASDAIKDPFVRAHLIRDSIGVGDARLSIGYKVAETDAYQFCFGPELTIPTALAFQKGVLSTARSRPPACSAFDFCEFMNLDMSQSEREAQLAKELKDIGLSAIDRLSDILLNQSLGNDGHWGLGFFVEPTLNFNQNLSLCTKAGFEVLLPKTHDRYFLKRVDVAEFDRRNFDEENNTTISDANLSFLNQRILEMVFPRRFRTLVTPGPLLKAISALKYRSTTWDTTVGIDYWHQGQENLHFINNRNGLLPDYRIDEGRIPEAQQLKLFGGCAYKQKFGSSDWKFFINGGTTVFSTGIGKDFSISAGLSIHW